MSDMTTQPNRAHNFSAGPAAIPTEVLQRAQAEMLDWQDRGVSVMEISHRSTEYIEVAQNAEANLRKLMNIPENYKVLFLQGGASLQFSAIPLNLLSHKGENKKEKPTADYLTTGAWSKKAIKEAQRYASLGLGEINDVASNQSSDFTTIPDIKTWQLTDNAAYFHYCANETIHGLQIFEPPSIDVPLVVDMSSCILSQPIDVSKFGMIYAGGQKNIGPAGLVIIIIREDLLGYANEWCPTLLDYEHLAEKQSMSNTPATYSWYLAGLVFEWLLEQGGVEAIAKINEQKAELLYDTIDNSELYQNVVDRRYRSIMNIPFRLTGQSHDNSLQQMTSDRVANLESRFLEEATSAGLLYLKGHRDVGGIRASIYNAVTLESVQALVNFMNEFERKYLSLRSIC